MMHINQANNLNSGEEIIQTLIMFFLYESTKYTTQSLHAHETLNATLAFANWLLKFEYFLSI